MRLFNFLIRVDQSYRCYLEWSGVIVQSPMALLQPERNCDHDEMRSTVPSDVAFWSSGHTYPAIIGCVGKCYNPNRV
jgi:hypothetical protein